MKIKTTISYAFFLPIIDLMHITSLFYGALAWGSIGLHVKALVRNVPVVHHRHVQNNGFELQHGCPMTSMNKVYCYAGNSKWFILIAWHIHTCINLLIQKNHYICIGFGMDFVLPGH